MYVINNLLLYFLNIYMASMLSHSLTTRVPKKLLSLFQLLYQKYIKI